MTSRPLTVALVGNPNTGKSTLFNALSGLRQQTGNYAGVTVEMKTGHLTINGRTVEIIDLPGTYSLAARSPDEMVAVDLLLGRRAETPRPDVILSIVDASNLDRHLYLTTQLMELHVPVVLAVNLIDVARAQGITIDVAKLREATGLRVVPIQANAGQGLEDLKTALCEAVGTPADYPPLLPLPIAKETEALRPHLDGDGEPFLARRLLLDVGGSTEMAFIERHGPQLKQKLDAARVRLAEAGCPIPAAEARARYGWIREVIAQSVQKPSVRPKTATDRLDRILTHRVWGTLIFFTIMLAVFLSIFIAAAPLMDGIKNGFGSLGEWLGEQLPPGPLKGLIVDGIIGGVGSVVVFLPQIMILFACLAVLEDCGYMARAAFLMDRIMSRCGLSGKSFIPLLSSVACAVPGIMATRVIEHPRDRLATILVAPLMSCSARLPVYSLMIGTFLGTAAGYPAWVGGVTLFGMYMIGFIVAPLMALLFKRTLLRGTPPAYVMELPLYKIPSLTQVLRRTLDAAGSFLKRAGTVILAAMVLIWAATYYPAGPRLEAEIQQAEESQNDDALQQLQQQRLDESYLGQTGHALQPLWTPLGWDWKIGVATLASFPAREVIAGTLGTLYKVKLDDDNRDDLGQTIRADWQSDPIRGPYAIPIALSVMVFFALCCQCVSTLAVIRRETRSWLWPVFTFVYMTVLAYAAAWLTVQIGRWVIG